MLIKDITNSEIRELAIENVKSKIEAGGFPSNVTIGNIDLFVAFSWQNSPQGLTYWQNIYEGHYTSAVESVASLAQKYPIGGFAPGSYQCKCVTCKERFMGDKRAVQCEPCATKEQSPEAVSQPNKGELFQKVYCKDELPETRGYYYNDYGYSMYSVELKCFTNLEVTWWLKPISLPTLGEVEAEAEKIYPYENVRAEQSCGGVIQELLDKSINFKRKAYIAGAKSILNRLNK